MLHNLILCDWYSFNSVLNCIFHVTKAKLLLLLLLFCYRNERELHFFTWFLEAFGPLFGFLLTLLGWKYQSVSIFQTHGATIILLIISVCICILALVGTTLPASNQSCRHFFKAVCLVSGAFACDLLLLVIVPPFGWFIFVVCVSILIWLLYGSYSQILQCCQEILLSVSNYASWESLNFRDWCWVGPVKAFHSYCINGSPLLTINVMEQQVTKLAATV